MRLTGLLHVLLVSAMLVACGGVADPATDSPPVQGTKLLAGIEADRHTMTVPGYRNNYSIAADRKTGVVTLKNMISGDVITRPLPDRILFVDRHTVMDTTGPEAEVYRLYQAAFARRPDEAGLGFWVDAHSSGRDLLSIAADFIDSQEFRQRYGEKVTDRAFVERLYENVLHRAGEASGIDWWLAQLHAGASRQMLLREFANSRENSENLAPVIENGFDLVPSNTGGPIPVKRSSFENRAAALSALGPVSLPTFANQEFIGPAYAIADFFQDGSYSMVVNTGDFSSTSAADGYATKAGKIRFFRFQNNTWVESGKNKVDDDTGCIGARKLVVADFNGDGQPDVFISCTGLDTMNSPGERPRFLMSQPNGVYANRLASFVCYCHAASAADVNGNGFADLVIADPGTAMTPFYLTNNKDGTFTQDPTRMPKSVAKFSYPGQTTFFAKQIYTIEFIDLERRGLFDLFIGANEPNSFIPQVPADSPNYFLSSFYKNDGSNRYTDAGRYAIPNLDPVYGLPLDIATKGNKAYLLRVISDHASPLGFYGGIAIQEVEYPSMSSRTIYRHTGTFHPNNDGGNWKWFPWFGFHEGKLKSADSSYNVAISP